MPTNIIYKSTSLNQLLSVTNNELAKLSVWFKANKSLNIFKTNYMLFSNWQKIKNETISLKIDESKPS